MNTEQSVRSLTAADDLDLVDAAFETMRSITEYACYHGKDALQADRRLFMDVGDNALEIMRLLSKTVQNITVEPFYRSTGLGEFYNVTYPGPVQVVPDDSDYNPYKSFGPIGEYLPIRAHEVLSVKKIYAKFVEDLTALAAKYPSAELAQYMAGLDKVTTVLVALYQLQQKLDK